MEKMLLGRHSFGIGRLHHLAAAASISLLLVLTVSGAALAQQIGIVGTVTSTSGFPLGGVTVRVQGVDTLRTVTDTDGRYRLIAPASGVLIFNRIGHRVMQEEIAGRTTIDVAMEPIAFLEEVVVTAYTTQRRADITGAVSSVNLESVERQTSASVLKRLDTSVPGVTVATSGSPGSRSTVRIRGISSFQNNDPLYIVDGTPVQDSYINWLNPNDITSIQVLKDASAASIYGSRASNGVIVIETTRREVSGPPRATMRMRTGIMAPVRGYDDFLITDALQYHEILRRSYENASLPVPTNVYGDPDDPEVPPFIWPNNCGADDGPGVCSTVDPASYSFPNALIMPGSPGTNWWDAVFGPGFVGDYNLEIAGGGVDNRYGVSFNYFDQKGTAAYNEFHRGSIRVNTSFTRGRLTVGENVSLSHDRHHGGMPDDPGGFAEDGILGKNILMQPVVPLRDIQGNFASGKAVSLGNQSNPLKFAYERRDNEVKNNRLFGNVFAGLEVLDNLSLRSTFGFNLAQGAFSGFTPITPENREASFTNAINENTSQFTDWTWSNTLTWQYDIPRHSLSVLLGQEANETVTRFLSGSMNNIINTDPSFRYVQDALGDAGTKNVSSAGSQSALLSVFGRTDYTFDDRYVLSLTLRRDGSSRLGPGNRWGTFPAFGVAWRLTNEPFLAGHRFFSDVMVRYGWGMTGNQSIPAGRIVSGFGGSRGDTFYDITGSGNSVVPGFRQTSLGNPDLKWEENRSQNIGADVGLLDGRIQISLDLFKRDTDNLLFGPSQPATAGVAAPPIVNIGKMSNRGFDMSIGYSAPSWSVTFNGSHYRNRIDRIDGDQNFFRGPISTRFGNQIINQVGHPIGSFYGYVADGYFQTTEEIELLDQLARDLTEDPEAEYWTGAAPGRIKFRDLNGDGVVNSEDQTIIGDPHPDFTAGLDLNLRRGNWDFSATLFGTFGNEIFDVQKEFYVFRNFDTNVRRDLLTDSWTPENPNAKYPRLDVSDAYSRSLSSFYVEDGSYIRLRNVQIGYDVPSNLTRWMSATRVYVQIENLFTVTGYPGLDLALPAANVTGSAGDIRDQYRGVDRGSYPSNKAFSIGLVTSF